MMGNDDYNKTRVRNYSPKEVREKRRQYLTQIGYYAPEVIRKHQQLMAEIIADLEGLGLNMGLALSLHKACEQENCFYDIHKVAKHIDNDAFNHKWLSQMHEMNNFFSQCSYSRSVLGFPLDL